MEDLFRDIFNRGATAKERIILRRLRKIYDEEVVKEAIRLSVSITEGSPIKYIVAVANNIYKEKNKATYGNLKEDTQKKLRELEKYGASG